MRQLFVQRHGQAERRTPGGERVLTARGQAALAEAAQGLARSGLVFAAIAHSPLTRARQTARAMAALLAPGGAMEEAAALAPGGDPARAAAWLDRQAAARGAQLMVGHMPEVAEWTASWGAVGGAAGLPFAPGSMARLDLAGPLGPGAARLVWHHRVEGLAQGVVVGGG